jgi:hypothetical protein
MPAGKNLPSINLSQAKADCRLPSKRLVSPVAHVFHQVLSLGSSPYPTGDLFILPAAP